MRLSSRVSACFITVLVACCCVVAFTGCGSNNRSGGIFVSNSSASAAKSSAASVSAVSSAESIIWAGDEVTGIIQVPSDWAVMGQRNADEYAYKYAYSYRGPNAETLDISLSKGEFEVEADKAEGASSKEAVSLNGHDAVKVVSVGEGAASKVTYFVNRPGDSSGILGTSKFEFSYTGEQPTWIEESMSLLALSDNMDYFTLSNGCPDIGESPTQWAGNESAGYVRVPNCWTPTTPMSSGKMMAYLMASSVSDGEEASDVSHLAIGLIGQLGKDRMESGMSLVLSSAGAKDVVVEPTTVNGIDGCRATGAMTSEGRNIHFDYCYLDTDGGTLIAVSYLEGFEVDVDEIVASYVESK